MALNRQMDMAKTLDRGVVLCYCSFSPNAGVPNALAGDILKSVTYISPGLYDINLTDTGWSLLFVDATLAMNAATPTATAQTGPYSASSKTIRIRTYNSADGLVDFGALDKIYVVIAFKNTAEKAGGASLAP